MIVTRRFGTIALAAPLAAILAAQAVAAVRLHPAHPAAAAPHAAPAVAVTTYHNDDYRSGQYVVSQITEKSAAKMRLVQSFSGVVTGSVYAQPLYWRAPQSAGGYVIVATESNHVTALDATTGKVVWDRTLAPPIQGGTLPCGNIAPEGVTGTPAIDPATGSLYVAASAIVNGAPASLVYGISLKNGRTLPGWPLNVGASLTKIGFAPDAQGERGALAVTNGTLYVPYGGRYGDCDNYHGTVVAISLAHAAVTASWQTSAVRGGVWSVGGPAFADNAVYVATGNTSGAQSWGGGEAVVRLTASGLKTSTNPKDFFAPTNWQQLDDSDLDLGGSNPLPLDVAGHKFIIALGKDGNAYVMDRTHLGGIGGQLASMQVSTGQIIGGAASWIAPDAAYVAFQGAASASSCSNSGRQGLTVLRVSASAKPSISTAWCGAVSGAGDPIVTTSDGTHDRIVWMAGAEGDNRLHGFAASNGAVIYNGGSSNDAMQNLRHMSTILAAQGRLYIPSDNRIYAFAP